MRDLTGFTFNYKLYQPNTETYEVCKVEVYEYNPYDEYRFSSPISYDYFDFTVYSVDGTTRTVTYHCDWHHEYKELVDYIKNFVESEIYNMEVDNLH